MCSIRPMLISKVSFLRTLSKTKISMPISTASVALSQNYPTHQQKFSNVLICRRNAKNCFEVISGKVDFS